MCQNVQAQYEPLKAKCDDSDYGGVYPVEIEIRKVQHRRLATGTYSDRGKSDLWFHRGMQRARTIAVSETRLIPEIVITLHFTIISSKANEDLEKLQTIQAVSFQ